jgi:FKBP-type peptidyl-prolyl cis-trans isomerase
MVSIKTIIGALLLAFAAACSPPDAPPAPQSDPAPKFEVTDIAVGNGNEVATGRTAVVHYTGWLFDATAADRLGKKFDSSRDRGEPLRFPVGGGRVIKGWDEGVAGMKVGGQRRLVIPPDMGYGARGAGAAIPPNATLLFDVELLAIE